MPTDSPLRAVIGILWLIFWAYWLAAAVFARKPSVPSPRGLGARLLLVLVGWFVVRRWILTQPPSHLVDSLVAQALGLVLVVAGLLLAVWARIDLGANWGMPMSERVDPELVTTGPYRYVRHPIYSGALLALIGTALASNLEWLIPVAAAAVYFVVSATVEERRMSDRFPDAYPAYRRSTKMLIPWVL